ncbi:MAG: Gfo/Idh/MocA family oxidoreductase [Verrucomicrobia bacterium]|nr:Gfo/Idh/MocA family oxidoreductase [Verrucomicrobiota bacterium]
MKTIRFGIIGGGLMGREFASAAARWGHLLDMPARPEVVALCDKTPQIHLWYHDNIPSAAQFAEDYRDLLANKQVEAVYVAVPHHLHEEIYCAAIRAGKHLMGEKPFGIDLAANEAILHCAAEHPQVFVRCSSESPFFPAMQRLCEMIERRTFGRIIEVNTGFLHSSDLDPQKPMNWKRMVEFNGEYGCMGDLGMHACHVPFRAGWQPINVRAILSKIVSERPDGKGGRVPCKTWDNATLLCEAKDGAEGEMFPLTVKTQRIAPGQKNTWFTEVLGTRASARWSSANPNVVEVLEFDGGEQAFRAVQAGYSPAFQTITGGIFEFGFTDSILQMWAAFVHELATGKRLRQFAGCVTPAETHLSHRLFTAALESAATGATRPVPAP